MTSRTMTPTGVPAGREAFTLPLIFLTVALAGGFRASAQGFAFVPPSLVALILAVLLLALLVRTGVLAPYRLLSERRRPLENLSGAILLSSLFAASAQVFGSLTPEAGVLYLIFNIFYGVLLWTTVVARPVAERALRSLLVVFGSALVLRYVVVASLCSPDPSLAKRVVLVLLEGVTLGSLECEAYTAATGYVAFLTIALFMTGLILLPRAPSGSSLVHSPSSSPIA